MSSKAGFHPVASCFKQQALHEALKHIIPSVYHAAIKWSRPCTIVDMTCGPGVRTLPIGNQVNLGDDWFSVDGYRFKLEFPFDLTSDGRHIVVWGSPLIFAEHIRRQQRRSNSNTPILLGCIDKNKESLDLAKRNLERFYPDVQIIGFLTDQRQGLRSLDREVLGLSYWDHNGYTHLDPELIKLHATRHSRMDILFTRACVDGRRMLGAGHPPQFIDDYLAMTKKTRQYVRDYVRWRWWTFGFASNYTNRREGALPGFVDITSEKGRALIHKFRHGE